MTEAAERWSACSIATGAWPRTWRQPADRVFPGDPRGGGDALAHTGRIPKQALRGERAFVPLRRPGAGFAGSGSVFCGFFGQPKGPQPCCLVIDSLRLSFDAGFRFCVPLSSSFLFHAERVISLLSDFPVSTHHALQRGEPSSNIVPCERPSINPCWRSFDGHVDPGSLGLHTALPTDPLRKGRDGLGVASRGQV